MKTPGSRAFTPGTHRNLCEIKVSGHMPPASHTCPHAGCSRVSKTTQALERHLGVAHGKPRDWFRSKTEWAWAADVAGVRSERALAADAQRTAAVNAGMASRAELVWGEHVDAAMGTGHLVPFPYAAIKKPDKWYVHRRSAEADECDERQNARGVGTRELARFRRVQAACRKPLCVIRWNPDRYDGPKVTLADRLALFVTLKQTLRRRAKAARRLPRIEVWYMFYSKTNQSICPGVPVHFVNGAADLPLLTPQQHLPPV
jgi:hypothetical protein